MSIGNHTEISTDLDILKGVSFILIRICTEETKDMGQFTYAINTATVVLRDNINNSVAKSVNKK